MNFFCVMALGEIGFCMDPFTSNLAISQLVSLFLFAPQIHRARLLDDVRANDQLQVRAEDGEEAPHGGRPRQAGEGETLFKSMMYKIQLDHATYE